MLKERKQAAVKIWDTAGQERFKSITDIHYQKGNGILIVYDITNRNTFENVSYWMD